MKKIILIAAVLLTPTAWADGPTLEGTIKVYPSPPIVEGQKPVNPNPTTNCCGAVPLKDRKGDCCYKPAQPRK